jgi:hypothetical protein
MLACSVAIMFTGTGILESILFDTQKFWADKQIWTLLSYPFVHNIVQEHIWFAVGMFMFYIFGKELEAAVGTTKFLVFYAAVAVLPALFCFFLTPLLGNNVLAGTSTIHLAVFLGYCVIHPRAEFFGGLIAKWVGIILLGIYSLMLLTARQWSDLAFLWSSSALAVVFFMSHSNGWEWKRTSKSGARSIKRSGGKQRMAAISAEDLTDQVNRILEKIGESGIQSLSSSEKAVLEKARENLLKKDKKEK